ncbi:hypothetical protein IAT38_007827 [Cryptococcus sp. DSM 104549]
MISPVSLSSPPLRAITPTSVPPVHRPNGSLPTAPASPAAVATAPTPSKRAKPSPNQGTRFPARTAHGDRQCTNCGEVDTPQWRGTLCNACALWKRSRGTDRPLPLLFPVRRRSPTPEEEEEDAEGEEEEEEEELREVGAEEGRTGGGRERFIGTSRFWQGSIGNGYSSPRGPPRTMKTQTSPARYPSTPNTPAIRDPPRPHSTPTTRPHPEPSSAPPISPTPKNTMPPRIAAIMAQAHSFTALSRTPSDAGSGSCATSAEYRSGHEEAEMEGRSDKRRERDGVDGLQDRREFEAKRARRARSSSREAYVVTHEYARPAPPGHGAGGPGASSAAGRQRSQQIHQGHERPKPTISALPPFFQAQNQVYRGHQHQRSQEHNRHASTGGRESVGKNVPRSAELGLGLGVSKEEFMRGAEWVFDLLVRTSRVLEMADREMDREWGRGRPDDDSEEREGHWA